MIYLGNEEELLLEQLCEKHNVNPDHLRILIHIKRENSYKTSAKKNELRNEIEKHIELWARKKGGERK